MLGLEEEMSYSRKSSESREKGKNKGDFGIRGLSPLYLHVCLAKSHIRFFSDIQHALSPVGQFGSWLRAKL